MSPYLQVRELYIRLTPPGNMSWEELVGFMLADPDCHVIKEVDFFVMGRPIPKTAPKELIDDLTYHFDPATCDTWHVWAIGGSVQKALRAMRRDLPWCAWERHGEAQRDLRFVSTASIRRLSLPDA